ncbi:hypothetical protein LTR72_007332 [Exophiala xenobiotica]|nr:hypothetical protein LTR72_007332 [Exophiala xenobiotica]KAK5279225.1 hypothetical protein LTR40_008107 [Exophiala xenobiotica]KAK5290982.1 hypothetical protein LTR14_006489 [Exophiala xenobiotica]KAK5377319.1 hypothetical protein LTS13_004189 [Exophiala xenobiotica]KAK5393328.1 hypothetical protein LTR79_008996 [Exophiala xenobiotica]
MPPRLAHRKSRAGCRRCKERKVKCTEERPSCAACGRHGVPCEYEEAASARKASSVPRRPLKSPPSHRDPAPSISGSTGEHGATISPPSGLDTPYSDDLYTVIPESLRHQIELYLIHRFKSSVTPSFPSSQTPHLKDLYVWHAMDAAFDHQYLQNAIFAITALYLWTCEVQQLPESRTVQIPKAFRHVDFSQLHRAYLNLAISEERDALSSLGPSNSDALGLTSILLSIMSTCLLSDAPTSDETEYFPPIQWLTLAGAVQTVFQAAIPFLPEGAMMSYLRASREPNFRDKNMLFDPNNAIPFSRVLDFEDPEHPFVDHAETEPTITNEAYQGSLALIGSIYNAVRAGEPEHYLCMRVVAFGPLLPKPFVRLLAQKRPRAMVILAHYMVFVKYIDSYWWFKGRAEKEILGIQTSLPEKWQWALRWPLAVLSRPETIISTTTTAKLASEAGPPPEAQRLPSSPLETLSSAAACLLLPMEHESAIHRHEACSFLLRTKTLVKSNPSWTIDKRLMDLFRAARNTPAIKDAECFAPQALLDLAAQYTLDCSSSEETFKIRFAEMINVIAWMASACQNPKKAVKN